MNQTPKHDAVEIVSLITYVGGENVTSAKRRSTWQHTNVTSNGFPKMWTNPRKNASLAVGTRPFTEPKPDDPDTRGLVEREPPLRMRTMRR